MVIYLDFISIFVGKSDNEIDTNGNTKGNGNLREILQLL